MKRRDFLVKSALASAALPMLGKAATPCPPPNLSVSGGTSVSTACTSGGSAEADWTSRSTATGVVWAHDFRSAAEVNNFRISGGIGNDPANTQGNDCVWNSSDGITGGCLQFTVPDGGLSHGYWARPFSPLNSGGNGRSSPDHALGGTLNRGTWNPNDRQACGRWGGGYYSHPDYLSHPTRGNGKNGFSYDNVPGRDFYLQIRCKMPANRFISGQPDGKLAMIMITGDGPVVGTGQPRTPNQEIVVKSNPSRLYQMYTNFGSRSNSYLTGVQGYPGGGAYQPGGAYNSTCTLPSNVNTSNCWSFPSDQWVTLLIHVTPGHDGGGGDQPVMAGNTNNDTGIQVWAAKSGETSYTKIWDKSDYVFSFGQNDPWPFGFNALILSAFLNDVPSLAGRGSFYHRYAQLIFSRQFIACPTA